MRGEAALDGAAREVVRLLQLSSVLRFHETEGFCGEVEPRLCFHALQFFFRGALVMAEEIDLKHINIEHSVFHAVSAALFDHGLRLVKTVQTEVRRHEIQVSQTLVRAGLDGLRAEDALHAD